MYGIDLNERAPGSASRANDRTLAAGVLLSVAVHVLFVAAIATAVMHRRPAATRRSDVAGQSFQVALLPTAGAVTQASPASSPRKTGGSAASRPDRPASAIASNLKSVPAGQAARPVPIGQPAEADGLAVTATAAAPAASAPSDPAVADAYRRRLLEHIAGYRTSPAAADAGAPAIGVVMVRFRLTRNGEVLSASVANSSGAPELDQAAVDTIWRAQPMPSIPPALPERLTVVLPVAYRPDARSSG